MSILIAIILSITSFFNLGENEVKVMEFFEITEVKNGEIRGEIIYSTYEEEQGEGIYLDESYAGYKELVESKVKVGDIIEVTYDREDYEGSIWDNILKVKVLR